ncbi:hypothetical protein [Thermocrinis minervae]|uniref:DUF4149 domain-containing protein n=1 Tax=Thermocrinis minervae TaxID=381751 RepID=A0A1M6TJC1_9AQUI|nr:hypothetical protein [Thermocrinis minervae]SHK57075.1 hypothetical protein SAMN05444391_1489 [Thermocrinis minervae]
MDRLLLSLYTGSLFLLVFVVAPVLTRSTDYKNLAGRLYGRILWRFYLLALFLLLAYLILSDEKLYSTLLIMGLLSNVLLSHYIKLYKRTEVGDIDLLSYNDPKRARFRKLSYLSTFLLFCNFILAVFVLFTITKTKN